MIDLFNFLAFQPENHHGKHHTGNETANRKSNSKSHRARPNTGGDIEHPKNDKRANRVDEGEYLNVGGDQEYQHVNGTEILAFLITIEQLAGISIKTLDNAG